MTSLPPHTTRRTSDSAYSSPKHPVWSSVKRPSTDADLPGVEVLARTTITVTNSPQTFDWVYGFKLIIPQGSLPAGVDKCRLVIVASVAGQYQFPDNLQLVSGVFWIRPLPLCQFQQQLTVEIQHCVKITSSTKLSFVRAHCSQESLPYTFNHLESRGSFTEHSSYGSLELNHFSGLAVAGENVDDKWYIASLYYQQSDPRTLDIHFVITWDTCTHIHATKKYFKEIGAKERSHLEVEFKKNKITLDIPMNGGVTIGEWNLIPTVTPCISRSTVDAFQPGRKIRSRRLKATLTRDLGVEVPACSYLVTLDGTPEPNQMQIEIDRYLPSKSKQSTSDVSIPMNQVPPSWTLSVPILPRAPMLHSSTQWRQPLYPTPEFTYGYPWTNPPYAPAPYQQFQEFPPSLLSVEQSHTSLTRSSAMPPPPPHWNTWLQQWSHTGASASGGWSDALNIAGPSSGSLRSMGITLDQLVSRVGIDKDLLDKECSDGHLKRISFCLPDWLTYANALGFTEPETRDITDNPQLSNSTHAMKALRVLEKWHRRHAFNATYHYLIKVCLELGHVTIATEICKMVKEGPPPPHHQWRIQGRSKGEKEPHFNSKC